MTRICAHRNCENIVKPNKFNPDKKYCSGYCSSTEYRWIKQGRIENELTIHSKICANRNCTNTFTHHPQASHQKYCCPKCACQENDKLRLEAEFEKLKHKYDRRDKQFKEL